jgi:predicted metal-dependent phosphoesterase TrpH
MGGTGGEARLSLVDLHTHTTESDGTCSPGELVSEAAAAGIRTLAITDHDTFAAHAVVGAAAAEAGIELIRGIELTCKHEDRNVHLLGYFSEEDPRGTFHEWLDGLLAARRDRNRRLAKRLQDLGLEATVEDAERYGRTLTGRPHFARVLLDKGYVTSIREAFDRYLGESGKAYVEREAPPVATAIEQIRNAGGLASLAHPIRLITDAGDEASVAEFAAAGLGAIEAFHTDHTAVDVARYVALAEKHGLGVTGGSDYHGTNKPGAKLGYCMSGFKPIPGSVVDAVRRR